jgi:hypothetical protein
LLAVYKPLPLAGLGRLQTGIPNNKLLEIIFWFWAVNSFKQDAMLDYLTKLRW